MVKDQIYYNDINVVHESMNKMIVKVETYTLFSKLQWLTERVIVFVFLINLFFYPHRFISNRYIEQIGGATSTLRQRLGR